MTTKIYSYGAHFRECPPQIDALLRQATRHYNTLVELENLRRAVFSGLEEDKSRQHYPRSINAGTLRVGTTYRYDRERETTLSREQWRRDQGEGVSDIDHIERDNHIPG